MSVASWTDGVWGCVLSLWPLWLWEGLNFLGRTFNRPLLFYFWFYNPFYSTPSIFCYFDGGHIVFDALSYLTSYISSDALIDCIFRFSQFPRGFALIETEFLNLSGGSYFFYRNTLLTLWGTSVPAFTSLPCYKIFALDFLWFTFFSF